MTWGGGGRCVCRVSRPPPQPPKDPQPFYSPRGGAFPSLPGPRHPTGTPPPARSPLCAGRFLYPPGSRAKRVRRDRSAAGAAIGPLSALSPPRAVGRCLHSPAPAPAPTGPSDAVVDRARGDLSSGRGAAHRPTPCERSNAASCTAWPLGVRGGFMRQQRGEGEDGGGALRWLRRTRDPLRFRGGRAQGGRWPPSDTVPRPRSSRFSSSRWGGGGSGWLVARAPGHP